MGFPLCYADLFLPRFAVYTITVFGLMRKFISSVLSFLGFAGVLGPEPPYPSPEESGSELRSMSALLIRELLPVVKYKEIIEPPESCAVCLNEFDEEDEIRWLTNCRHIFHRSCVDRWMDHDQKTCPLCRTAFFPEDMQEAFNERLWFASGISELYGDLSPITSDL